MRLSKKFDSLHGGTPDGFPVCPFLHDLRYAHAL